MKDRKLATRYARALLATLTESADQDRAGEFLEALSRSLRENAELRGVLLDPACPAAAKTRALQALAATHAAPPTVGNFLTTVAAHGRLGNLVSIAEVFQEEREKAQGILTGTLTTAAPISAELEMRAASALTRLSGRRVNLKVDVDPGLMGGAIARVGSMVYDGSIRTQLDRLHKRVGEES